MNRPGDEAGAAPLYSADYHAAIAEGSRRSAEVIVPLIMELIHPCSVIDVGCGTGAWLAVFRRHGIQEFLGVDGASLGREVLDIPPERFLRHDLRRPLRLSRTFDLAVCVEVAEHLSPDFAETLVASLTGLAPVVVFSAAIPYQGGMHHVNEQWPEYWAERFRAYGYVPCDDIRWRIWDDAHVEWFYTQNLLVFAERSFIHRYPALREAERPLSVVHPRKYLELCMPHGGMACVADADANLDGRAGLIRRWLRAGRQRVWQLTGFWVGRVDRGSLIGRDRLERSARS